MPFADPDDLNASVIRLTREATTLRHTLQDPATQQRLYTLLEQAEHQIADLHRVIPFAQRGLQQLAEASAPIQFGTGRRVVPAAPSTTALPLSPRAALRAAPPSEPAPTPPQRPRTAPPTENIGEPWRFTRAADLVACVALLERLLAAGTLPAGLHADAYTHLARGEYAQALDRGEAVTIQVPAAMAQAIREAVVVLPLTARNEAETLLHGLTGVGV
jgi:hypothetical protein